MARRIVRAPECFETQKDGRVMYDFRRYTKGRLVMASALPHFVNVYIPHEAYPTHLAASERLFFIVTSSLRTPIIALRRPQDGSQWWVKCGDAGEVRLDLTPDELIEAGYPHCLYIRVDNVLGVTFPVFTVMYTDGRVRVYERAQWGRLTPSELTRDVLGPIAARGARTHFLTPLPGGSRTEGGGS